LSELGDAAVHALDRFSQLIAFNFGHTHHISCGDGGGHATGRLPPAARPDPLRFFRALFLHGNNTSSLGWPSRAGLEIGEEPPSPERAA
jgi:hypothetical protein